MNGVWSAASVAEHAGGRIVCGDPQADGPSSVTIDSRQAGPGALFVGLAGSQQDGGAFAAAAIAAGAWGVIVTEQYASSLDSAAGVVVIVVDDPLRALAALAQAWRRELGCAVIAVTGSTGKTSTKDIIADLLAKFASAQVSDQARRGEDADQERAGAADQNLTHQSPPPAAGGNDSQSASATTSSPTPREPLISSVSPGSTIEAICSAACAALSSE